MNMYIERVQFSKNYIIEIILNGNYTFFFDLKPYIRSVRFNTLTREEVFESGRFVDGCRIVWDNGVTLEDYEMLGREFTESLLYSNSRNSLKSCANM